MNNDRENRVWASHITPQEQHVPVRAFNALEVRDTLKKGMSDARQSVVVHD